MMRQGKKITLMRVFTASVGRGHDDPSVLIIAHDIADAGHLLANVDPEVARQVTGLYELEAPMFIVLPELLALADSEGNHGE
jgi:hypothetical protein